jgi:hypothetical protein
MTIPDAQGAELPEGNSDLPAREVGELLGVAMSSKMLPIMWLGPTRRISRSW